MVFYFASPSSDSVEPSDTLEAPTFIHWKSLGIYEVTAYCACPKCCGKRADKRTACGYNTSMGGKFVAAPVELRFTSVLFIPAYGTATVLDRGGSIKGKKLDVFYPTHQKAIEWGVKELEIFIYE